MRRTGMWMTIACALIVAAGAAGCDGGSSTGDGGTGGSTAGSGGTTASTGGTGGATTSTGGTGGTTTSSTDPCSGVIEGFVPEWKPSTGLHQNLCTEAQITDLFAACIEPTGTKEDCDAFLMGDPANDACRKCVVSGPDDPEYGPITLYPDLVLIYENPGQCVSELEGDASDASCGAKVFSVIQCSVAACSECVDVDFDVLLQCLSDAEAGSCKPFADERDSCLAELPGKGIDASPCLYPGGDFYAYIKSLALLGCGP